MEDSGNVFFYAALVLIAFISWVVGRVREAIESYRERQRLESRRRSGGSPASPAAPVRAAEPAPTREQLAAQALRETYRALGVPFPDEPKTEPPPALSKPKQSPSPKAASAPAEAKLSYNERAAVASLKRRTAATSDSDSLGGDAGALLRILSNRSSLRQAIVLKEVLDPPKALRNDDR